MLHEQTTSNIINAFYKVYNTLGFGFLEKVYENALYLELRNRGLFDEKQKPIAVHYEGTRVGDYFADLVVDRTVIIELKAADAIVPEHSAQLLNYLKAMNLKWVCSLILALKHNLKERYFPMIRKNSMVR